MGRDITGEARELFDMCRKLLEKHSKRERIGISTDKWKTIAYAAKNREIEDLTRHIKKLLTKIEGLNQLLTVIV